MRYRIATSIIALLLTRLAYGGGQSSEAAVVIQNDYLRYEIGADGRNAHFVEKRTGKDYCDRKAGSSFARVRKEGKDYDATAARITGDRVSIEFAGAGARAVLRAKAEKRYLTFEVVEVEGEGIEALTFMNLDLSLKGEPDEPFAACALALNLQTNVPELPQANSRLRAVCYPRFGFAGAKVAIIGCPTSKLRQVMQEVVSAAPDLPHSPIGGPWALEGKDNRGSYLFNFNGVTEKNADEWIRLAKSLGINQIDFHGGYSFRFGDITPNPDIYPNGRASLKAAIDKLHAAGIAAGLHTYAFFIAKDSPWVTPVPDPRLAKDAVFTLAQSIPADAADVPTVESTEKMTTTTGFFVWNSVTIQIDDELIIYTGVQKELPYAFTGCQRGAYGTKAAAHKQGAKIYHLKECFGLFLPDPDSTLFEEVAAATAETFNECGFDMMYLDALDGEGILGGPENGWHYGSKFVFEIWKRLKRPALQEMSTFHHHLWFVRSRMGAWDHPRRSHKRFIDIHCKSNEANRRMFLPGHLGWWALMPAADPKTERTYPDDIEYLCCKCIGTECGLSVMGIDPDNIVKNQALARLGSIIKDYEELRRADYFPKSVRKKLAKPGRDFTLERDLGGKPQLREAEYFKHKFESYDGRTAEWAVNNRFDEQPARIRIEALWSAAPYDVKGGVVLVDFEQPDDFTIRSSADGVKAEIRSAEEKDGRIGGVYRASTERRQQPVADEKFSQTEHGIRTPAARPECWSQVAREFSPPLDLSERQAVGVWIYGDGQGETLNFQLRSPEAAIPAIGDHYVVIDFKGWRYFELIEPEGERYEDYRWPYGNQVYAIYRENVDYRQIKYFSVWYGNLPPEKEIECRVSPVKALPIVKTKLRNPKLSIGGETIEFPTVIESGGYLEFRSTSDCKLYGPDGSFVSEVRPRGEAPMLKKSLNRIRFSCEGDAGISSRAKVTLSYLGKRLE